MLQVEKHDENQPIKANESNESSQLSSKEQKKVSVIKAPQMKKKVTILATSSAKSVADEKEEKIDFNAVLKEFLASNKEVFLRGIAHFHKRAFNTWCDNPGRHFLGNENKEVQSHLSAISKATCDLDTFNEAVKALSSLAASAKLSDNMDLAADLAWFLKSQELQVVASTQMTVMTQKILQAEKRAREALEESKKAKSAYKKAEEARKKAHNTSKALERENKKLSEQVYSLSRMISRPTSGSCTPFAQVGLFSQSSSLLGATTAPSTKQSEGVIDDQETVGLFPEDIANSIKELAAYRNGISNNATLVQFIDELIFNIGWKRSEGSVSAVLAAAHQSLLEQKPFSALTSTSAYQQFVSSSTYTNILARSSAYDFESANVEEEAELDRGLFQSYLMAPSSEKDRIFTRNRTYAQKFCARFKTSAKSLRSIPT